MAIHIQVKLVLLSASILLWACSSAPEPVRAEPAQSKPRTATSDMLRFVREETGRRQTLELRKRAGGGFDSVISVAGACSRTEAGPARVVKTEGDGDVEVDPDGEGHPTDAFALAARNKCRITIRLAAPERDYAWLRESDCASECPLSNKAMSRK